MNAGAPVKNIGRLSRVDHRSDPSDASNARTVRSENPTTIDVPEIAGDDANRASPLISSSQAVDPSASSNATTCARVVRFPWTVATTDPSETASALVRKPPASAVHRIAPVATSTAYTVPVLSPRNAVSPSTVTPVRLTSSSGTGASHTASRVSRSIAATCESNEPASDPEPGDGEDDGLDVEAGDGVAVLSGGLSPKPSV